jgi:membrane protein implicated in regulation of membrane protease activity
MSYVTLWVLLGTSLLVAEMLSGTFVLLFFSLGAFSASLLAVFEVAPIEGQILCCGLVSAVGFFLLKKPLQKKMLKTAALHADLGKVVAVDTNIAAGQSARIAYQGTTWDARNAGTSDLLTGDQALIVGTDGNILLLKKQTHK